MKTPLKGITSRKGHRGARRVVPAFDGSMPRAHYKNCGGTFLICFKAVRGKDKVIARVHDPRSAKGVCSVINGLRVRIAELESALEAQQS